MDEQLVIRISKKQKLLLKQLAMQKKQTVGAIVREAVAVYVTQKTPTSRQKTKREDVFARLAKIGQNYAKKTGHAGPKDLSVNYKRYLYSKDRIE